MPGFFSKLFDKAKLSSPLPSIGLPQLRGRSERGNGRREPPTELDWSSAEYIPLPPSPPTWELDGRREFHREYNDPAAGPVLQAGMRSQHAKVVKLASTLSPEQRRGRAGEVVAKAYSKLIIHRMKAGHLAAAARQCLEMFELVPENVKDVDRRRFNKIVAELDASGRKHEFARVDMEASAAPPLFTVSSDAPWTLQGEQKLHREERPDVSFDVIAADAQGFWLLDRAGPSAEESQVAGVLRRVDRFGAPLGEAMLRHDVYRTGTSVAGSSVAIMDSSGTLHVYDAQLKHIVESDLSKDPRVVDHFRTIETSYWGAFKSQVRAVDVSPSGDRYLFTLADEAWCCSTSGHAAWGVVTPLKDGWKRVVTRSERFGIRQDVEEALQLFGLTLPVEPSEIKQRYRKLALTHHPDRNAGNPAATEKMKALNQAFQVLTGVDPASLVFEDSDVTYFARTAPDHVIEVQGFRLEITVTGGTPQDWVYAASFSADGGAYLATYSGKVILVASDGKPKVVYDIGTCPLEIVSTEHYTYFRTPTRLYVIEDYRKLAACIDIFKQGRLLVSPSGFGLLTGKHVQWFTQAGAKIGELTARDPIRSIHASATGAIISTRQHQIEVIGLVI